MKDTVVFINIFPLGSVFADSLEMGLFSRSGYKLVYLDLTKIYYPVTASTYSDGNEKYVEQKDFFINCQTKEDVLLYIKKYASRAWFFPVWVQITTSRDQFWIFRAFKKYGCDYILQDYFPQPEGIRIKSKNLGFHILKIFSKNLGKHGLALFLKKSLGWISLALLSRDIYYKTPSFSFVAGKKTYDQFKKLYPKSKIVSVPSFDYFKCNCAVSEAEKGDTKGVPQYDYLLYYDQSTFDSPDMRLLGKKPFLSAEKFYKKINHYFEQIENITGKKVVIAGSPKRKYAGHEFDGRDIVYDLTAKLTYHADLIILHTTLAHNYAVALAKPFIILKMEEYDAVALKAIYSLSSHFNKKVMSMEQDIDTSMLDEYIKIDHKIYRDQIYNYMAQEFFSVSPAKITVETLKISDTYFT